MTKDNYILDKFSTFAKGNLAKGASTNNCVIYTRVSTKEQADNNMSLTTQKKACELYALKHNYSIVGSFGGTYESAKTDERKEFNKMLSFVKKSKEKVSFIIVYSVDRFSRSGANAIYITEQLRKQGVLVVSVTQPTDSTTPSGSLQQNIQYIFSEYDNQLRREKCMSGVKEAILRGEWCYRVPMGYDVVGTGRNRQMVLNQTGKLLKNAFLWKAQENLSIEEIKDRLNALGIKIYHQKISALLKNPFYCGLLTHPVLEGKVIEGKQEPMVSKEIFLKVNDILDGNHHGYTVKHENEEIPLKNFVKCDQCGASMPGYIVKKKNLWYYKCRTVGCCNNRSAKKMHDDFVGMLTPYQISFSQELSKLMKREILSNLSSHLQTRQTEEQLIRKQLLEVNSKLDRLEERFILEEISREQFVKFSDKFKAERVEINNQLERYSKKVSNLEKSVDELLVFSRNLTSLWTSSQYNTKVRLQNFIFPGGITYNKKNDECRTSEINPLFSYIAHLKRGLDKNETGTIEINFNCASLVENIGVEPMTFCMPSSYGSQPVA
ncbi:MAG TPA: recombinase family protein [Bacteroidia bacterium]